MDLVPSLNNTWNTYKAFPSYLFIYMIACTDKVWKERKTRMNNEEFLIGSLSFFLLKKLQVLLKFFLEFIRQLTDLK